MRFEVDPSTRHASPSASRKERTDDESWLAPFLANASSVVELGAGSGGRAALALASSATAQFHGFEPAPSLLAFARSRLAGLEARASLSSHDPALPLPLPEHTADLFLCCDFLEHLRPDQLYMACSEAARVLRPGGIWLVRTLAKPRGIAARCSARLRAGVDGRPIELDHFFSPENWQVAEKTVARESWLQARARWALVRLPGC